MVQVHAKLRDVLHVDVPVIELFKYPTVSSLAKYFNEKQNHHSLFQQTDLRVRKRKEVINRRRAHAKGM